jgi:hypothetical protein
MQELPPADFDRVRPLFEPIQYHRPAIFTVLEGNQPGRVFVDRVSQPGAVLILSDFCYFGGSSTALDLREDVLGLLEREGMANRHSLLLFPFSSSWEVALDTMLQPYQPRWYARNTFTLEVQRFRQQQAGWQQRIPAGFALQPLDAATALEVGGIPELWGSVERFLANGFGFCLIDESQPAQPGFASSAQTVFVGDCHAETGVGTREAYQRRGLATSVCCAYIEHCLQAGILPEWGCVLNEASENLAGKLGFGSKRSWPFAYIRLPT